MTTHTDPPGNATSLSEFESRLILEELGIPLAKAVLARSPGEAVAAAATIGYPVVLKGSHQGLVHKSEANVIRLRLADAEAVLAAYDDIDEGSPIPLDGVLVQEMVSGDRELVMGMVRDPQFGPCVMFGLGGIFTEVFADVTFRIAPLGEKDAYAMMREIRGAPILGAFRGMEAAEHETLARCLVALGNAGLADDRFDAVDINPLILTAEGKAVAVDSVIFLAGDDSPLGGS